MKRAELLLTVPMLPDAMAALDADFVLHRWWEADHADAFIDAVGARVEGLVTSGSFGRIDGALMDRLPRLQIVASLGVGYDNVDAAAAAARGVVVTNTPGVLDDEVADLTIGLLLATVRRIPQADRFVREGRWQAGAFPLSPTLRGRRIGIAGLGNIGKAIARRLEGFGVAIAYHGRSRQAGVGYDYHPTILSLAEAVDTLIVIVPGGDDTRHLIDARVLDALGPQGVLVNVSRGSVVDEPALVEALADGRILAAGLDVFADEPHVPAALLAMENVVLLPHVGSATRHTRAAMAGLLVDNLAGWFGGAGALTPVAETRHLARR